jgi:hypothetical protein
MIQVVYCTDGIEWKLGYGGVTHITHNGDIGNPTSIVLHMADGVLHYLKEWIKFTWK